MIGCHVPWGCWCMYSKSPFEDDDVKDILHEESEYTAYLVNSVDTS